MIEKPKGTGNVGYMPGQLMSPGSASAGSSGRTVSTNDMSSNNPLAESLTAE